MEEIKLNLEHLTNTEREQLMALVSKANDYGKKEATKKQLIEQLDRNLDSFYGANREKYSKMIRILKTYNKNCIDWLIDNGYNVFVVTTPCTKLTNVRTRKTEDLYCPTKTRGEIYDITFDIKQLLWGSKEDYTVWLYLPFYKDFNDNTYKTCWTFGYTKQGV